MTSPTPDNAVRLARTAVEQNKGIGPAITAGVVAAVDIDRARITDLETAIANNEQHGIGYQAGYTVGLADADAVHAANPPLPAKAPPRKAPTRAMAAVKRLKDDVLPRRFRTRLETDKPGDPATGPFVLRATWVMDAINPTPPAGEDTPPPAR